MARIDTTLTIKRDTLERVISEVWYFTQSSIGGGSKIVEVK